jgi:CheY-like chemotaxis protein
VLVDDDKASLDLLSAYLDGSPVRVLRARDGADALELIRKTSPSAVVLDIRLPRIDGWQVLAELKGDPTTAEIPVVVVSVDDDRARGMALGAAAYLFKPVRRDDLLAALQRVGGLPSEDVS